MRRAARSVPPDGSPRNRPCGKKLRKVATRQVPQTVAGDHQRRRDDRAARHAARPCGVLRARRPLSAALVPSHDGDHRTGGRGERDHRGVPAAGCDGHAGGDSKPASIGCCGSVERTRLQRSPTGRSPLPRVDKIVGPGNAYVSAAKALVSPDCGDRLRGRAERDRHRVDLGSRGLDCRRFDRAIRARSRCACHSADAVPPTGCRSGRRVRAAAPRRGSLGSGALPPRRDRRHAVDRRGDRPQRAHRSRTRRMRQRPCRPAATSVRAPSSSAVTVHRLSATTCTGSNHVLPTSGAARVRGGLSAADFVRVTSVQRISRHGLARIGPSAAAFARAEGLIAHARSIEMRLEGLRAEAMGEVGAKAGLRA